MRCQGSILARSIYDCSLTIHQLIGRDIRAFHSPQVDIHKEIIQKNSLELQASWNTKRREKKRNFWQKRKKTTEVHRIIYRALNTSTIPTAGFQTLCLFPQRLACAILISQSILRFVSFNKLKIVNILSISNFLLVSIPMSSIDFIMYLPF